MSGSAVLGGAFGFSRASAAAQDDPAPERLGFSIVQGGATAAVAAGVGAFAWKSRDILAPAAWGTARGIGESATRSMSRAFQTKGLTGMLSHPLTVAGFGTVAGGLIGSKLSDDPVRGAAAGAAIGGVTTLAARGATKLWGGSPWYAKAALVAAAAIGAGTATRAFTHEDSYAAEDHAVSDGSGGYETEPGVRRRMSSMNATGDVVFGLHSRRH
jgi:hypothetical protein